MKAPDKIYVHITPHLGLLEATAIPVDAPGEQEYIRKDALIEWLENKIKISDGGFVNGLLYLAYKDVIEHLNGM